MDLSARGAFADTSVLATLVLGVEASPDEQGVELTVLVVAALAWSPAARANAIERGPLDLQKDVGFLVDAAVHAWA
jgi:hypothetical protein